MAMEPPLTPGTSMVPPMMNPFSRVPMEDCSNGLLLSYGSASMQNRICWAENSTPNNKALKKLDLSDSFYSISAKYAFTHFALRRTKKQIHRYTKRKHTKI